jgi:hypothetical protein
MAAIFSIIIILASFQDKPLMHWTMPIQINSLIATLTTIGKTAMLVAVAESISQLKWLHFYQRAGPLDRFQDFDDASRGPWGSVTLLRTTNVRAVLASLGAIITIFGLAIEPMAQQILEFPARNVTLTNVTSSLGRADKYFSKAIHDNGYTNVVDSTPNLLQLQSSFINGLVGRVAAVNFTCPIDASSCQWPAFSTLGACSSCQNITNFERKCTYYNPTTICDYTSPDIPALINERSDPPENESTIRMLYDTGNTPTNNRSWIFATYVDSSREGITTVKTKDIVRSDKNGAIPPPVDIEHCTWQWCVRDYENVTATGGTILENHFTSEMLTPPLSNLDDTDTIAWIHFNTTRTNRPVKIELTVNTQMWIYLTEPLNSTLIKQDSHNTNVDSKNFDYGNYLYNGNMTQIASDIADTITNQIRSQNLDNENATFVEGDVIINETYIHVRWPWLILPLAETVLAAVLLLISILISQGRPLWKSSALAPYIHPLQGWNEADLAISGYESAGSMGRLTKGMTVALDADANGHLKMLRR